MKSLCSLTCLALVWVLAGPGLAATPSADAAPRPQTPKPPYPYLEREMTIIGSTAGVRLAGTLTLPRESGRVPALILVSGSGPDDRDVSSPDGHRFFQVWADFLTRRGFAVLRLDDRSVGGSVGPPATAAEIAIDIADAVRALRAQPEIDADQIGLIGHSEGADVAAMVARADARIPFLVMLAASTFSGAELTLQQMDAHAPFSSAPAESKERARRIQSQFIRAVAESESEADALNRLKTIWNEYLAANHAPATPLPPGIAAWAGRSERAYLQYDPLPALRALTGPVLVVLGENDLRVPLVPNEGPLREALRANPRARVEVVPGVNHFMQPAKIGTIPEAKKTEVTVSPAVLNLVAGWLAEQVQAPLPAGAP